MLVLVAFQARDAVALLIPQAGVTDTDGGFEVPVRRQYPVIPVSKSASGKVAVVVRTHVTIEALVVCP